jgi:hypothetical protein
VIKRRNGQIIVEAYLKVKKKMHAVYRIDRGDFG